MKCDEMEVRTMKTLSATSPLSKLSRCRSQSSHPTRLGTWCGPTSPRAEPADEHATAAVRNLAALAMAFFFGGVLGCPGDGQS